MESTIRLKPDLCMNRACQKPMNFCRERPEGIIGARTITERTSGPGRNMYSPFLASRNVRPDERTPLLDQAPHYLEFNRPMPRSQGTARERDRGAGARRRRRQRLAGLVAGLYACACCEWPPDRGRDHLISALDGLRFATTLACGSVSVTTGMNPIRSFVAEAQTATALSCPPPGSLPDGPQAPRRVLVAGNGALRVA